MDGADADLRAYDLEDDGRLIGVFSGSIIPDIKNSMDEINFFYPIQYFWSRFHILRPRPVPPATGPEDKGPADAKEAE